MRKLFFIILLNFVSIALFAQQNFRLGLTASPTIGWIKADDKSKMFSNGSSIGFTYGLIGDFNITENYAIATAIQITTINGQVTQQTNINGQDAKVDAKYRMKYLEIPIAVKLKTDKIGDLVWFGKFGLSNGFRLGANRDISQNNQSTESKIGSITSVYRAGLLIGGGAEYNVSDKTVLSAGLTFNNAFTNFLNENGIKAKNHYFAINLGLFF